MGTCVCTIYTAPGWCDQRIATTSHTCARAGAIRSERFTVLVARCLLGRDGLFTLITAEQHNHISVYNSRLLCPAHESCSPVHCLYISCSHILFESTVDERDAGYLPRAVVAAVHESQAMPRLIFKAVRRALETATVRRVPRRSRRPGHIISRVKRLNGHGGSLEVTFRWAYGKRGHGCVKPSMCFVHRIIPLPLVDPACSTLEGQILESLVVFGSLGGTAFGLRHSAVEL